MNIKYLFIDVDGTLVDQNDTICQKNLDAIAKARKHGLKVIINSGRVPCILGHLYQQMNIEKSDDEYMICSNGSYIVTTSGKVLFDNYINKEDVILCTKWLLEKGIDYPCFASLNDYYSILKDGQMALEVDWPLKSIYAPQLENNLNENIYKFHLRIGDDNYCEEIGKKLVEITDGRLQYSLSERGLVEAMMMGSNKGQGIIDLCNKTGVDIKDTISIGDNYNDLSMMTLDNYRACPNNGEKEIKELCHYISALDCSQGAVGDIIENYILKGNENG